MARILLINPNKWGRGITTIWIASHTACLRQSGHEVSLFDATFYKNWAEGEVEYNTENQQYQPSEYDKKISWNLNDIHSDLEQHVADFKPDLIFWSALSSHIHGEGEYVNIQYGYDLAANLDSQITLACGGLQPTAAPLETFDRFRRLGLLIRGESELPLTSIANHISAGSDLRDIPGLALRQADGSIELGVKQTLASDMDAFGFYDYSVFDDQVFWRPYNGEVVRAADYELSRGCIYTCTYCVETVIQNYYGFTEKNERGSLVDAKKFLRHKSADLIIQEWEWLYRERGVTLIRCQDTNFLTIDRSTLTRLAELLEEKNIPVKLYIETRPEGVNENTVKLLRRLQVDGVGMGLELATQSFRENSLRRFSDQEKIIQAFKLLRDNGIKRTAYNIIGLANQDEASILETIAFNRDLDPDNITVAFYSPFIGTDHQKLSAGSAYFQNYEFNIDPQLRTLTRHEGMDKDLLGYYKKHFVKLVRNPGQAPSLTGQSNSAEPL